MYFIWNPSHPIQLYCAKLYVRKATRKWEYPERWVTFYESRMLKGISCRQSLLFGLRISLVFTTDSVRHVNKHLKSIDQNIKNHNINLLNTIQIDKKQVTMMWKSKTNHRLGLWCLIWNLLHSGTIQG